jgi:hypothetical protein
MLARLPRDGWVLVSLAALVLVVRLGYWDRRGIWEDEAFGYFAAAGNIRLIHEAANLDQPVMQLKEPAANLAPVRNVLEVLRWESQYGPAYHLLLHGTMRLTGTRSVAVLKLWNVAFAVLTGLGLYLLARRGLSMSGSVLAVLLYALSPYDIALGLQLKGYALLGVCVVFSTLTLLRLVDDPPPSRWLWAAYALLLALGILIHYFFLLVLPLHALFVASAVRFQLWRSAAWLLAVTGAGLLVAPSYVLALRGPPPRWVWLAYALLLFLAVLIHGVFLLVLVLLPALLVTLTTGARLRRGHAWLLAATGAGLVVLPWYVFALGAQCQLVGVMQRIGGEYHGWRGLVSQLPWVLQSNLLPLPLGAGAGTDRWVCWGLLGLGLAGATGLLGPTPAARRIARLTGFTYFGGLGLGVVGYFLLGNNAFLWPRYYAMFLPLVWVAVAAAVDGLIGRCLGTVASEWRWFPQAAGVSLRVGALAAAAVVGGIGTWQLTLHPLEMVNDWRQVTRQLKGHVRPGEVVVHVPAHFAFLGFAYYWDQPNVHTTVMDLEDATLAEVVERAQSLTPAGQPVWFLLSWGQQAHAQRVCKRLAAHGWRLSQTVRFDYLIALQFQPDGCTAAHGPPCTATTTTVTLSCPPAALAVSTSR